jgi:hypothetical protein
VARWNPWRALREQPALRLVFATLPRHVGRGALLDVDGRRTIVLDDRLSRRERRAVLGHELVHAERNILYGPGVPRALIDKEENAVNRITAERLVPLHELGALVARAEGLGEGVSAADVEDAFDVPAEVAARALWLLDQRWRARPRPSGGDFSDLA